LGQGTGSAFGAWLIADLHGNIVAAVSPGSSPALLSAYRYDAYGETCGSWSAGSGSIAVPWRFQGRLLESATGGTDLYDFGARSYDPSLGAFTSFDSVAGSAQNPLTLNRYLYANANPATLVDPDGHYTCHYGDDCDTRRATSRANDTGSATKKRKASAFSGTTDMSTSVYNFVSWSANTDMTTAVDAFRSDTGAGACAWDQTADECKNIAAENKKQHYWELCNGGDKSACDTMDTISVDVGDPVQAAIDAGGAIVTHTVAAVEDTLDVHTVGWCAGGGGFVGAGLGVGLSVQGCVVITGKGQVGLTVTPGIGVGQGVPGLSVGTGPMFSSGQDVEDQERNFNAASLGLGVVDVDASWGFGHCKITPNPVSSNYVGWSRGSGIAAWEGGSFTVVVLKSSSAGPC